MQNSQSFTNHPPRSPTTPPYDSSIEELDDLCVEDDPDILENITDPGRKPHFLDYDAMPPPGFEEDDCSSTIAVRGLPRTVYPNENIKVDKIYETDGEISDFELSHRNQMKRDQNTDRQCHSGARRKKHFLDENPIPPDYDYEREREHRSLDRNFERTKEYTYERKHSLDRECSSRKVMKDPSYTLTRFLENDVSPIYRGGTWPTNRSNEAGGGHFSSMPTSSGEITNQREAKVECVYSLLSMLGNNDQLGMSSKFLELSKSPETCATLRQTRCIPLIVQMIHSDADEETKKKATMALHNVVNSHPDDKAGRREAKVLKHIEQIMDYCDILKTMAGAGDTMADVSDCHPSQAISSLMKISFDQQHRNAMCELGALQAIASLVHYDHASHGHDSTDTHCILLRRYAGMALTNLTFGDSNNKASLCTNKEFMKALVAQLNSTADDLLQATASVLRNLSWRANDNMKTVLNEIGTVTALSKAVMQNRNENTLKALLSALWNLSAHCSMNKAEFCAVDGALAFLVDMLVYDSPSKKLTIIENAGGILRNVSSHIAVKEDYRKILRKRNCLGILLNQLQSESLTIVSNACGTLWNLSARCPEDQQFLLDNKAVSMLSLLIHSKHKMISNGSNAALKNLLNFRPGGVNHTNLDPVAKSMRLKELPSLNVRKQRAREQELDQNLSETCDNIDVTTPPKEEKKVDEFLNFDNHRKYQFPDPPCLPKAIHSPKESTLSETTKELSKQQVSEEECASNDTGTSSDTNDFDRDDEKSSSGRAPIPAPRKNLKKEDSESFGGNTTYQETDLDQITNFSLRYGENQNESSDDNDMNDAIQQPGFVRVKRGLRPAIPSGNVLPNTRKDEDLLAMNNETTDPYFPLQWYLRNTGQNGGKIRLDLNVQAAWDQGITGKNVTTAIMDDGVDYMHPDLKYNYNAEASYDFSSNDPYPYPRYTDDWFNSHGTRCAGEVAAARDNGICGVGVAYDSKIAGIRMLDQPYMTDLIEANSMGHEPNKIHIYSASWGPTDDGKTVDGPRNATMRAIVQGVNEGRNGLGNIYVWASGDGGEEDDCNCDGYAASMWTISINSAINDGQNAHYDESCSSTLARTFSNGAKDPNTGVATTDLYGKCTTTHSGTSAAAPEAAGVFALALEANPMLTWRDIQHLTVLTSKRNSLFDAKNRFHWTMNGVGLEFNDLFGFGVLDAGAMVTLSKQWRTVPPRYHCEAGAVLQQRQIPSSNSLLLQIETNACKGTDTEVNYLEHVQAVISANSTRRGDLELFLTSPMGTRSMILSRRANDDDHRDGFTKWPFMATHTWGEYPQGIWILEVKFNSQQPRSGWLKEWSLVLHGTKEPPYRSLSPASPHSKLAIVKKAHEDRKMM